LSHDNTIKISYGRCTLWVDRGAGTTCGDEIPARSLILACLLSTNMIDLSPPTEEEIEKMIDADFIERAKGLGPKSWEWYAKSLKHAADVILERYNPAIKELSSKTGGRMNVPEEEWFERDAHLISTYYLLMGYAIENLIKGIIMIRHPEYLRNNTELIKEHIDKNHDTNALLRWNEIDGFRDDWKILNGLSKCVIWVSKYPVPFKREKFDWVYDWMDPIDIDKLYEKLYNRLDEEKARFK
jgi:hypothetical protein